MSIERVFDIAGSGMNAQSVRLNTTASNIANAETASSSIDEAYRARHPIFAAVSQQVIDASGSHDQTKQVAVKGIVENQAPLDMRYEPNNPLANDEGYVFYPNVNVVEEMTNMISASRSFQINVEVMNSAKQMMQRVLTLGQ